MKLSKSISQLNEYLKRWLERKRKYRSTNHTREGLMIYEDKRIAEKCPSCMDDI